MRPSQGDIYCHRPTGLLCLVLDDRPHLTCGAWRVQFLTGNDYIAAGYETSIYLFDKTLYYRLETK